MSETILTVLQVDQEIWKLFEQWSLDNGSNPNRDLNQFILRSLNLIESNLDDPLITDIEVKLEQTIANSPIINDILEQLKKINNQSDQILKNNQALLIDNKTDINILETEQVESLDSNLDDIQTTDLDVKIEQAIANSPIINNILEQLKNLNSQRYQVPQNNQASLLSEIDENTEITSLETEQIEPSENKLEDISTDESSESSMLENLDNKTEITSLETEQIEPSENKLENISTDESSESSMIENEVFTETKIENNGLTDQQLAEYLTKLGRKVSSSTVSKWRKGKSTPSDNNKNIFSEFELKNDRWFKLLKNED